ncbi:helix-turn-helix domain-containing protein [Streptomyces sp. NBC_01221]|uniref:helix-turn-helix domain-containing protein n=1 Tax=unclassified Streptomyces TaxID=2593676 RepID=UPI0022544D1A|nr:MULTISPECIES: helix-turn-helix domain-containing protein [unclassified Streptomyces]MCX4788722.1 helix-turn-helix domain-containing protein [Streptomyces sp. NBC_01221]MCX4795530.1 helix-turn-helix domain-containing protein [Streptomyces sp. NBC_01242]WSJ36819.1 helix-turn-helix domain-containing protein [Streptomyces sp. NBC_01321]WSP56937.1 helix-turn-helix domain-containing protein [Streptomyces sp. NBC_01241]
MDTQQVSAPSRAPSPVPGDATPSSGVMHINSRHTTRFTVVGNHLAQHRELSLLAIGLATHIQSLPTGAKVGIKTLTERFPEGETRIAAALRELEAHGYLKRTRERLPDGRVITRTCSYNQPGFTNTHPVPAPERRPKPSHPAPAPAPAPVAPVPPAPVSPAPVSPPPEQPPHVPAPTSPKPPPPPLPQPNNPLPQRHHAAIALLADLHRDAPQLILTERDIHALAPAVATWYERGATPTAIRHALTNDLPRPLKHPAKLLRHRLTHLLPPPPTVLHQPTPLQNCNHCDRAFRSPAPGNCRDCESGLALMG